jgi:hypothetical protein
MGYLYGRAGRFTPENTGSWPGRAVPTTGAINLRGFQMLGAKLLLHQVSLLCAQTFASKSRRQLCRRAGRALSAHRACQSEKDSWPPEVEPARVSETPCRPRRVGPTPALYRCTPTRAHGPTCSFWADLTPSSLAVVLCATGQRRVLLLGRRLAQRSGPARGARSSTLSVSHSKSSCMARLDGRAAGRRSTPKTAVSGPVSNAAAVGSLAGVAVGCGVIPLQVLFCNQPHGCKTRVQHNLKTPV